MERISSITFLKELPAPYALLGIILVVLGIGFRAVVRKNKHQGFLMASFVLFLLMLLIVLYVGTQQLVQTPYGQLQSASQEAL